MKSRAARRVADDGFTLIEVVAAIVVLAILATGVATVLSSSLQASRTSRQRVAAANLITKQMELIRNGAAAAVNVGDYFILPNGATSSNATSVFDQVDGTPYTLQQTVRYVAGPNAATDSCAGTGTALYKSIIVTATWPNMSGTKPVRSDTVINPDAGDIDANAITIPVRVRDRDNLAEVGVVVTLSGNGVSTNQFTDSFGCVVFADIPSGTYTATVTSATSPPSVNWQGASTNSVTVGSSVGGTWVSTTEFQWDTAARLTLTPTAPDGSHPVPAGLGAAIANTNLTSASGTLYLPSTGTAVTTSNVFPFGNGYESWAGTCADADPKASGGSRKSPTIVDPGGSANIAVATQAVNVTLTMKAPKLRNGQTILAVHGSDAGCPSGMTVTLPGTTSASGTLSAALPYGSWQFRVSGALANTVWPTASVSPAGPSNVSVSAQ